MKNQRYILKDNKPQPRDNPEEWAMWMGESNRPFARDEIVDVCVSTAFIGVASGEVDGVPVLFETMVLIQLSSTLHHLPTSIGGAFPNRRRSQHSVTLTRSNSGSNLTYIEHRIKLALASFYKLGYLCPIEI